LATKNNMTQDRQKQRNQLIRQALQAAVRRIDAAEVGEVFAPVGELVFWIIAADEGLQKQYGPTYTWWRDKHRHGQLLQAIRYVRNRVAHESEAWDYEYRDVWTDRWFDRWGALMWVQLPPPGRAPNKKVEQRRQKHFAAYNQHLRDKPVIDTTMNAVDLLEDWWKQQGI
jgi:hypothetical protein